MNIQFYENVTSLYFYFYCYLSTCILTCIVLQVFPIGDPLLHLLELAQH